MRIYTRGGDKGTTSLIYGRRTRKDSPRVAAYGEVDEVNAHIGMAMAFLQGDERFADLMAMCQRIQRDLFDVGRELATPEDKREATYVTQSDVDLVEQMIDQLDSENPPLQRFILPGGHAAAAAFHVARTVARRCERTIVHLQEVDPVVPEVGRYLNRLSDFLFVAARVVHSRTGAREPGVDFDAPKTNPLGGEAD